MMFKKIAVAFDESAEADRGLSCSAQSCQTYVCRALCCHRDRKPSGVCKLCIDAAPDVPGLLKSQRRTFYEDLHSRAKLAAEQSGITFHAKIVEGDEIQALLQSVRPTYGPIFWSLVFAWSRVG